MNFGKFILVFLLIFASAEIAGAESLYFEILAEHAADHGNPNINGSIANRFVYCANSSGDDVIVLVSDATYWTSSTLVMPAGVKIIGKPANRGAVIAPTAALDDGVLIDANDRTRIYDLDIHGANRVRQCINAAGKSDIGIVNCSIRYNKNNYTYSVDPDMHLDLVYALDSEGISIMRCTFRNAGWPKVNPSVWYCWASCIELEGAKNALVYGNDIAYALSSGISFQGADNVAIIDNSIQLVGLQSGSRSGNGITTKTGALQENVIVQDNEVFNYMEYGIVVAGYNVEVVRNVVYDGYHRPIVVGHPSYCSGDVVVTDNIIADGWSATDYEARVVYTDPNNWNYVVSPNYDYDTGQPVSLLEQYPCDCNGISF